MVEGKSHTYLYGQVAKLEDILRFDLFLSFSLPSVELQTVSRVGDLETSVGFLIESSCGFTY